MTETIVQKILAERERQRDILSSEHDTQKSANDWVATINSYVCEAASRSGINPTSEDFEDAMIKSAAIILAALEYMPLMIAKSRLES